MSERVGIAVGDEVSFLDEEGGGTVLRMVDRGRVVVRTWDGFELEYPVKLVVKREVGSKYTLSDHHAKLAPGNEEEGAEAKAGHQAQPGGVVFLVNFPRDWPETERAQHQPERAGGQDSVVRSRPQSTGAAS